MASGFGVSGGQGRCYPFWMDFSECMAKAENPKDCVLLREDYLECLHHRKEISRLNTIRRQERKNESGGSAAAHHPGPGA